MALVAVDSCGGRSSVDDVICASAETVCSGSCTAKEKDPTNCGACGNVCPAGTVCFDGACATTCGGGTIQCGQSCVDPKVDHDNCGACGHACGPREACVDGSCSSACASAQSLCMPADGEAYCASVATDNANCGACGQKCGPEQMCSSGSCVSACLSSQATCVPDAGVPYCASIASDPENCGACNRACANTEFCSAGVCTCSPGLTRCGADCVDLATDSGHCGACAHACLADFPQCTLGHCYAKVTGFGSVDDVLDDPLSVYDYVADATKGTITRFDAFQPLASITVASLQGGPLRLALDQDNIYWSNGTSGEIMKLSRTSGTPVVLATGQSSPRALVTAGSNLYWITDDVQATNLKMMPVSGGPVTAIGYANGSFDLAYDSKFDPTHFYLLSHTLVEQCSLTEGPPNGCVEFGDSTGPNVVFGNGHGYGANFQWVARVDGETPLSSSTKPSYVGLVGSDLYWADAVPKGQIYVTDALVGGAAQSYADVEAGTPGPMRVDLSHVVWGDDTGTVYVLQR